MPTRDADTNNLIADFHSRIEGLKRDGVPDYPPLGGRLPWAEASEERKLENIVWESMSVWVSEGEVIDIPDFVRLETVERNVDYAKLPEDHRNALHRLRAEPGHDIAMELERISGLEYDGAPEEEREPAGAAVLISPEMDRVLTGLEKSWPTAEGSSPYDKFLSEATDRAMSRMQGKEPDRER